MALHKKHTDCGCGHDHGHEEHHHEESCGCGHDHGHEEHHHHEEHCGCGHDHGHEEHHHEESCGCGHDHGHEEHHHEEHCGCGHDHGHEEHHHHEEQHHEEHCGCGHDHGHEEHHHHEEHCGCGHDHGHEEHHHHEVKGKYTMFTMEQLGCAHCASKMEDKIRTIPGVDDVTITFATKQMRLSAKNPMALLPEIQAICTKIEPDVKVVAPAPKSAGKYTMFTMENLACAHCASKMEDKIRTISGVDDVTITFATKQMRLVAKNPTTLLPHIQAACTKIEPDVKVVPVVKETAEKQVAPSTKKPLVEIIIGAVLFAVAMIFGHTTHQEEGLAPMILFGVAYVLLGWKVLLNAVKNLLRGQMLDENFLMSIATIGAIVLGEYSEAVGVMLFYRVGEYCEERAVNLSRKQITEAVDLRPDVVTVVDSHGNRMETPAEEVEVGQTIQVLVGDRIPLDGVILSGESRLDTAAITGEPVPVSVKTGDTIHSGSINLSGVLTMKVTHVLEESMVSRILHAVEDAAATKPKIERVLTKFAHVYTPVVVAVAVLTAIIPSLITGDWNHWVHTALTFLVISCPCALVLSVPLAFFSGIGAGSKQGVLFKSGASLEALRDIQCVAMDKTGTLTLGNFVVQEILPENGLDETTLLTMVASCEQHSTHPIAVSIVEAAHGLSLVEPTSLKEVAGKGLIATYNGKTVLCGNEKLMADQKIPMGAQPDFTGSIVHVAVEGKYVGKIHVADTIKEEATCAIASLKKRGLKTAMLTGDNVKTAQLTAQTLGLDDVKGNLLPTDKVDGLLELRAKHGPILYIGDGINDAPVLAGADVGGAMGSGADAAIEVADVVFMTSDLTAIDKAVSISKRTHTIVRVNIWFALAAKILVMILGITGIYSSMWLAIFADVGVALICVLNAVQTLYRKR